jgi:hypothetical protein
LPLLRRCMMVDIGMIPEKYKKKKSRSQSRS